MLQLLIQQIFTAVSCDINKDLTQKFNQIKDKYDQTDDFITDNIFTIPCGVTKINDQIQLFKNKNQLLGIIIPNTVEEISQNAFKGCQNLLSIIMPNSVKTIGSGIFQDCLRLQYVELSSQLQTIPENAFNGVKNLIYIEIPASVNKIEKGAFVNVPQLQCAVIPNDNCQIAENSFDKTFTQNKISKEQDYCQVHHKEIGNCNEQNIYIYIVKPKQCVLTSTEFMTYLQNGNDKYFVEYCLDNEFIIQSTGAAQCLTNCTDDKKYYYFVLNNLCVEECTDYLQYYIYQEQFGLYQCSSSCSNEYALKIDSEKECVSDCTFYTKTSDDITMNYCITECNETYKFISYYQESQRIQCLEECTYSEKTQQYIQEDKYCLTSCTGDYAIPITPKENNTCSSTCKFFIPSESSIKYCTDSCPNDQSLTVDDEKRYQCVSKCSDAVNQKYYLQQGNKCVEKCDNDKYIQENICVDGCTGLYAEPMDGSKVCSNTCNIEVDQFTNKKHCIDDCQGSQLKTEISEGRYQCSNNCNEIIIDAKYQSGKTCTKTCEGEWALPVVDDGKVCSNTCDYYILETSLQKKCIGVSCPQGYNFKVQREERYECIKECDKEHTYIEGKICVEKCTYPYAKQLSQSKVCHDSCTFRVQEVYTENSETFCVEHNQCNTSKGEIIITIRNSSPQRSQCVTNCNQSIYQELKYQQNNQCVAECEKYWYINDDNSNICLSSCAQQQLEAYNLQTLQCETFDTCEKYYHIISSQYDVYCFFVPQISSCQEFAQESSEQYQQYKYVLDQSTECVTCQEQDYEIKDKQNLVCEAKQSSNKAGAIAGGVVAAIVVVIIIIVVIIVCVKKSQKKQHQDIEMKDNETEQETVKQDKQDNEDKQEEQVPVSPQEVEQQVQEPIKEEQPKEEVKEEPIVAEEVVADAPAQDVQDAQQVQQGEQQETQEQPQEQQNQTDNQ